MKRIIAFFILLLIVVIPLTAYAATTDPVEQYALDYFSAVEAGKTEFTAKVETTDAANLLHQMFLRYPVLYYYYNGYSSLQESTTTTITILLQKTDVPWQDVYVINSDETLKSLIGLGLTQLRPGIRFVTTDGYVLDDHTVIDLAHEIRSENYLAYMGFNGNGSTYWSWQGGGLRSYDVEFHFIYDTDPEILQQWRDTMEQIVLYLATNLFALDMPDYRKELLIHDWLVNNSTYNIQNMDDPASHTAYGPLVEGKGVCQGYSEAMMMLARVAGIPCQYVVGDGGNTGDMESHAWNCIQIGGQWYMLDVTWDDPVTDGEELLLYDYFNITSGKMAEDHTWDYGAHPECTATELNIDRVRQLCENDTTQYTQYSAERFETQQMSLVRYLSELQAAVPRVPTEQWQVQSATHETTEPQVTEPAINQNPQNQETLDQEKEGKTWVGITFAVIGVETVTLVILLISQSGGPRRREITTKTFDPTMF